MAKKKACGRRKKASKRTLIAPRGDKRYIRRDARGRIRERRCWTLAISGSAYACEEQSAKGLARARRLIAMTGVSEGGALRCGRYDLRKIAEAEKSSGVRGTPWKVSHSH